MRGHPDSRRSPVAPLRVSAFCLAATLLCLLTPAIGNSQQYNQGSFKAMRWRLIGPFRAGRVTAVSGVPSQPNTFYMATPGGGVWKTMDAGQVWKPIF
ncbi:MAG: hypothetical protein ACREAC_32985, partial [Blastocatellia bacterium]